MLGGNEPEIVQDMLISRTWFGVMGRIALPKEPRCLMLFGDQNVGREAYGRKAPDHSYSLIGSLAFQSVLAITNTNLFKAS